MMLFRSARNSDLDAIHRLAEQSGAGMTTLPKNKALLRERLQWSSQSYKKKIQNPECEYYLFVLEEEDSQQILGTSAIEARIGSKAPFYSYKVSKHTRVCHALNIRNDYEVLSLVNDHQGRSEVCTLFLDPQARKNDNGLLLSKSRFLFMAEHPYRFAPTVIAEMRGVSDERGQSPFWDNIGANFFYIPFVEADRLTLATNKQFIADLMPRNPIYVTLLTKAAQAVIGKPHPSTVPAMSILLKEGFRYTHYVDIFDAGPTIEAPLSEIKTIALSRVMVISNISDEVSGDKLLLANTRMDFRATIGHAILNKRSNSCMIDKKTAKLLKVSCGDNLRIAPIRIPD